MLAGIEFREGRLALMQAQASFILVGTMAGEAAPREQRLHFAGEVDRRIGLRGGDPGQQRSTKQRQSDDGNACNTRQIDHACKQPKNGRPRNIANGGIALT
jgi:hypothetical protein